MYWYYLSNNRYTWLIKKPMILIPKCSLLDNQKTKTRFSKVIWEQAVSTPHWLQWGAPHSPQNYHSCWPIPKPNYLPHPWTHPTYNPKPHPYPISHFATLLLTEKTDRHTDQQTHTQVVGENVRRLYTAFAREHCGLKRKPRGKWVNKVPL